MTRGDRVYTDRFLNVTIDEVFESTDDAWREGYTEEAYYRGEGYAVLGKQIDEYHMDFCAAKI